MIDVFGPRPVLPYNERRKFLVVFDVSVLRQQADDPRAEALDEVETKSIEAQLFDKESSVFKHGRVDNRIAVAQMRKASEVLAFHHHLFIAAGVKTVPVARKFSTLWIELRPALLPVQRINLLLIRAGVMVDDHVGIQAHPMQMGLGNQCLYV